MRFTLAEVPDGEHVSYPGQANDEADDPALVLVQSVVVDSAARLPVLDTGSPSYG